MDTITRLDMKIREQRRRVNDARSTLDAAGYGPPNADQDHARDVAQRHHTAMLAELNRLQSTRNRYAEARR